MDTTLSTPHRTLWQPSKLDIALVVLIVAAIFIPAWLSTQRETSQASPIEVVLTDDSLVLVDNLPVTRSDLVGHLKVLRQQEPDRRVVVRSAEHVKFNRVRSVLAAVEGVGFPHVSLRTQDMPID
jgi:biopolymer transport protein ExbD